MKILTATLLSAALAIAVPLAAQETKPPDPPPAAAAKKKGGGFKGMDKNNDGKISKEEFTGKEKRWSLLDKDKDGFVTMEEFRAGRKKRR